MQSGPEPKANSFWGDLFDIATEAFQKLFGLHDPVTSNSQPVQREAPRSTITIVELDAMEDQPTVLDISADPTPEEQAKEQELAAKNSALTYQYLQKLEVRQSTEKVEPNADKELQNSKENNNIILVSTAYKKYQQADKAITLKSLISLMEGLGEDASKRLLSNDWLGSSEVNRYFDLLAKAHADVYHIDSGMNMDINKFRKSLEKPGSKRADQMRAANRIFWPICQESHWHLIIMEKNKDQSYNVSCLDSLGWSDEQITRKANLVLQALYPNNDIVHLVKKKTLVAVPKQNNFNDCGVSICYWGAQVIKNPNSDIQELVREKIPGDKSSIKKAYRECDYSQYRFDIAEMFAKEAARQKSAEKAKQKVVIVIEDDEPLIVKSSKVIDGFKFKRHKKSK